MSIWNTRNNKLVGTTIAVGYSMYLLIRLIIVNNVQNYPHLTFGSEVLYIPLLLGVAFIAWRWQLLGGISIVLVSAISIWLTLNSWLTDISLNRTGGWIIGDYYYTNWPLNVLAISVFCLLIISGLLHITVAIRRIKKVLSI